MQGRQVVELFQVMVRSTGDQLRLLVVATVDNAMAYYANVVFGLGIVQVIVFDKRLEDEAESISLVIDFVIHLAAIDNGLASPLVLERCRRRRQAAHLGLCNLCRRLSLLGGISRDFY